MKCKNCGAEIPKGELYCPICGWEVRLVPDYETVESMLSEKEMKEKAEREKQEEEAKKAAEEAKKRRPKPAAVIFKIILAGICTAGVTYLAVGRIDEVNAASYVYQKNAAERAYDSGDYSLAEKYVNQAAALRPDSSSIQLLRAGILAAAGNSDEAVSDLEQMINADPDNTDAYEALIKVYVKKKEYTKIASLVKKSDSTRLRKKYASYIVEDPEFSMISGIYAAGTTLKISSESGSIYYTTDGSNPTKKSTLYDGTAIVLPEGKKTTVKAIAINEKGIKSKVITGVFTIASDVPDSPGIEPDSGSYTYGTEKISVTIPEGCTVYYTFDGTPAAGTGIAYTQPVDMPRGTHIFSAIAQDTNGHVSKVISRTYQVS